MRDLVMPLAIALAAACGGKQSNPGPGLPACTRPAATSGCVATWTGSASGSGACSQMVTQGSGGSGWTLWIDGGDGTATIQVGVALQNAPAAGSSFSMQQMVSSDAKLLDNTAPGGWEAASPQGDVRLQVDGVVQGSGNIHGTLSGSLAPNPGSAEPGVQLCVFL